MILAGTAVFVWSRDAFAPAPQEWVLKPSSSLSAEPWSDVLRTIDTARNRAIELRDITALAKAVHQEGPAFVEESELIERLIDQDVRVSGLRFVLLSVQERFRRWNGMREFVELEVRDRREGFNEVDALGRKFQVGDRSEEQWRVTLMRESEASTWRLWSVGAMN